MRPHHLRAALYISIAEALAIGALLLSTHHSHAQALSGQMTARTTAYCEPGVSRSGEWTRPGMVAVDPNIVPLYSTLSIEGLGDGFQALDTGGGVRGAHIDIYMPSCFDAIQWGVRERQVEWWP